MSPTTWGLLLFAFEAYVLFRAFTLGRGGALWLLIPTFVLWANIDQSFLTGLLVLAAAVVGLCLDGTNAAALISVPEKSETAAASDKGELGHDKSESERRPSPPRAMIGFIVLAYCAAACLLNPFTYRVYAGRDLPVHAALGASQESHDCRSAFVLRPLDSPERRQRMVSGCRRFIWPWSRLGLGSFLVNANRFSWSRFLPFALVSVIWGTFMHANPAVRGRVRRGRRDQRPGVVPRSVRDRRPAGRLMENVVDRRPAGHAWAWSSS